MLQAKVPQNNELVLVAVGGNTESTAGPPPKTVLAAVEAMSGHFGAVRCSPLYVTPAFPAGAGPDFINAACAFSTSMTADAVLNILHQIEADFGRERLARWGQRTLDLDLIGYADLILPDAATFDDWMNLPVEDQMNATPDRLVLPHPRLQDRSFVLVPLADVAPDWVHPRFGVTVADLLAQRPADERATVLPVDA